MNANNAAADPPTTVESSGSGDVVEASGRAGLCLICGSAESPTVEHIIPQTLWTRFGIDPNHEDLARYRTTLCGRHNKATSVLHERTEMLDLIAADAPINKRTLQHLADWAVWVTLLLGLARNEGVLGPPATRALLVKRFDDQSGGIPRGFRVYAARVRDYITDPAAGDRLDSSQYSLALVGDDRILLGHRRQPIGYSARTGTIHAAEAIGLGRVAVLVVGPSYRSGPDHLQRLDQAAATVEMTRIHPILTPAPKLEPRDIQVGLVSRIFTVMPHGTDMSLTPEAFRLLHPTTADADDESDFGPPAE